MTNPQHATRRTRTSARILPLTLLPLLALAALGALVSHTALAATTFTVNSTGDGADSNTGDGACNDGAGNCTLRAAIQQANATAGTDTINFSVTGTINLTGKLPDIFTDLSINGPGPSALVVRRDTGGDYNVLTVSHSTTVNISGLTLTNGKARDGIVGEFGGSPDKAGGVANFGGLNLTNVVVTGNRGGNGGDGTRFGAAGGEGAGIYNFGGTLTMKDCAVTDNITGQGGNGPDRAGSGGDGAGIYNTGTLTLTDCVISGNRTGHAGDSPSNMILTMGGRGAGIFSKSGTVILLRVTVRDNITGNGGVTSASAFGRGGEGAGLYFANGVGRLKDCTISGNRGGLKMSNTGSNGFGGGITNNAASLTIYGSTISDNTGDIAGAIFNFGMVSLTNSTVSGNHVIEAGECIYNVGTLTLSNSTITGNEGVGVRNGDDVAVVRNTIIAGNGLGVGGLDVQGAFTSQGHNLVGNAGTGPGTHSTGFGVTGDQVGYAAAPIAPQLGPLQDNGGPTLTHALLAGSPALDAGSNSLARDADDNALTADQRGVGRFSGPGVTPTVDVGAVEFNQFMEDVSDKATNEDTPLSFAFFTGDQTVSSLTATSDNQTLLPDANISITTSGRTRTITLTPAAERSGTANITINLTGSFEGAVSQTFVFTVASVNDAPSFTKGPDQNVAEDSGPQAVANWATGLSVGPNEAAQSPSFVVTGNTAPGLFSTAPAVSPAGALTYTPAPNANGSATITLVLKDDGGTANGGQDTSAPQTFVINVTPVNDPPVAAGFPISFSEDSPILINFSGTDPDGDSITFEVVNGPAHGTLSGTGNGRTYTPAANYNGTDSFTYKAVDAHGAESSPATISLTINAVNDAPVNSVPGAQVTNTNTPIVFSAANSNAISVSDVDAGTDPVRVTISNLSGRFTLGSTAGLTFIVGDGVDDGVTVFTAPVTAANAALNGLSYTPLPNFNNGFTSIAVATDDQGFNGSGGAKTDTDNISVQVRSGGLFRFLSSQTAVFEESGSGGAVVIRWGTAFGAASVKWATTGGSATGGESCNTPGVDYIRASGTLNWADGDASSKPVNVTLCDDVLFEPFDTIVITLSDAGGSGTVSSPATASLFIDDDDPPGGIIELEQSSYTVAEGAGSITVKVKRRGDTTRKSSVTYATDDGSIPSVAVPCATTSGAALDRCDYTKALGTFDFAPGETEKTFEVLVGDDSFVEGTETALIKLSNPGNGAEFGPRAVATLQINDDAQEPSSNPVDGSSNFVRQHYYDFLSREPDAAGLAFWTGDIEQCGADAQCREVKRIHVSAAFFLSIEFQQTGFLVYRLHKVAYGNLANKPAPLTFAEFLIDTQSIGRGVVVGEPGWEDELAEKKAEYASAFVARGRFTTLYNNKVSAAAFVDALNANAGGVLSQAERDALVSDLQGNAKTSAQVLVEVAEHPAVVRRESNQAFVLMQYFGYLRRDPESAPDSDFGGYNFWLGKLNEFNGDFIRAEMVKAFISSDEYRRRFGQQ